MCELVVAIVFLAAFPLSCVCVCVCQFCFRNFGFSKFLNCFTKSLFRVFIEEISLEERERESRDFFVKNETFIGCSTDGASKSHIKIRSVREQVQEGQRTFFFSFFFSLSLSL